MLHLYCIERGRKVSALTWGRTVYADWNNIRLAMCVAFWDNNTGVEVTTPDLIFEDGVWPEMEQRGEYPVNMMNVFNLLPNISMGDPQRSEDWELNEKAIQIPEKLHVLQLSLPVIWHNLKAINDVLNIPLDP